MGGHLPHIVPAGGSAELRAHTPIVARDTRNNETRNNENGPPDPKWIERPVRVPPDWLSAPGVGLEPTTL